MLGFSLRGRPDAFGTESLDVPCGNQSSEKLDLGSGCQERAFVVRLEPTVALSNERRLRWQLLQGPETVPSVSVGGIVRHTEKTAPESGDWMSEKLWLHVPGVWVQTISTILVAVPIKTRLSHFPPAVRGDCREPVRGSERQTFMRSGARHPEGPVLDDRGPISLDSRDSRSKFSPE